MVVVASLEHKQVSIVYIRIEEGLTKCSRFVNLVAVAGPFLAGGDQSFK